MKNTLKHTPGPWETAGTEVWGGTKRVATGKGAFDEKDREKIKANTLLISASPELLEACRVAIDMLNRCGLHQAAKEIWGDKGRDSKLSLIAKAIAKAEGR